MTESIHFIRFVCGSTSCNEDASTTGFLDSLLSSLGEKFGLNDDWDLWEVSFAEDLEISLIKVMLKSCLENFNWINLALHYYLIKNILQKSFNNLTRTYGFGNINHWCLVFAFFSSFSCLFRDEWPQLVGVDGWAMFPVSLQVENSHTELTVVSRMAEKRWN